MRWASSVKNGTAQDDLDGLIIAARADHPIFWGHRQLCRKTASLTVTDNTALRGKNL
jgi:hypothetical protein